MWFETLVTQLIGEKKRWRGYKARVQALPEPYRSTIGAFERYLLATGGLSDGDSAASLLENLADLFDEAAAAGTPVRDIVGEDPLEFIEAFIRNYPEGDWRARERRRLIEAVDAAAGDRP